MAKIPKQAIYVKGERFPLRYKIMRAERLAASTYVKNVSSGNEVINGIEYSREGAPVAYHIQENSYRMKTIRVPAEFMTIHTDGLPGTRPRSYLVCANHPDMNNLININNYALIARRVQSAIALITSKRKDKAPSLKIGEKNDSTTGLKQRYIEPGMIIDAGDNDVHSHIPTPSDDLDPLTKLQLRGVAVGFGFSYELLSGDYRDTTFAGGRLAKVDSGRGFRQHALLVYPQR